MFALISIVIYLSLSYTFALFVSSRRRRPHPMKSQPDLLFVFVVPCLNEERVIASSLERLQALEGNFAVLVIDDGSEDATSEIVQACGDARVHLLRREPPNARQGKGRALNAAYRYLIGSGILGERSFDDVVVVVVDADGRIAPNVLSEVAPHFRDPTVGAVQIGVRMYNATSKLLTRMQDLEFITYTEIFQRARQRLGSVGLGGNGQFARLSALCSLGDTPWSDCLTEDLDLGLLLLANGWKNAFCPTTRVNQQALTKIRPLIRQRTRWFQGHLQTWRRIPLILRAHLPLRTTLDVVNLIINPALVLATSLLVPLLMVLLLIIVVAAPLGFVHALTHGWGINVFLWYLLTFGLAPFYAFAYWMQADSVTYRKALGYAHLYNIYGYMWFLAGWRAVGRIVLRKSSWSKTGRIAEATPAGAASGVAPGLAAQAGGGPVVIDLTDDAVPAGRRRAPDRVLVSVAAATLRSGPPADFYLDAAGNPGIVPGRRPIDLNELAARFEGAGAGDGGRGGETIIDLTDSATAGNGPRVIDLTHLPERDPTTVVLEPGAMHRRRLVFGAGTKLGGLFLLLSATWLGAHAAGSTSGSPGPSITPISQPTSGFSPTAPLPPTPGPAPSTAPQSGTGSSTTLPLIPTAPACPRYVLGSHVIEDQMSTGTQMRSALTTTPCTNGATSGPPTVQNSGGGGTPTTATTATNGQTTSGQGGPGTTSTTSAADQSGGGRQGDGVAYASGDGQGGTPKSSETTVGADARHRPDQGTGAGHGGSGTSSSDASSSGTSSSDASSSGTSSADASGSGARSSGASSPGSSASGTDANVQSGGKGSENNSQGSGNGQGAGTAKGSGDNTQSGGEHVGNDQATRR